MSSFIIIARYQRTASIDDAPRSPGCIPYKFHAEDTPLFTIFSIVFCLIHAEDLRARSGRKGKLSAEEMNFIDEKMKQNDELTIFLAQNLDSRAF